MRLKPLAAVLLATTLTTQLTACGTVFYPERRGQISGEIDPGVAILNGIGLLFYIIPGVVAFAVDFATGAIYLPDARYSLEPSQLQPAIDADGKVDKSKLQAILHRELNLDLQLDQAEESRQPLPSHIALLHTAPRA
ncbi:polyribonucleotide nucleotidyltransferase [Halopseudomonas sabulinigri]|uniref:Uncharacterized protein n=1 Tax=Halopseudomonas sabulinigri TaxID=472181 RepID=A0A1H1QCB7_9GAMM|nr:polyribonucleotide nucleotidyltransferase [Halopseudomonas sabulinigri]SDS21070.1 hypothetical protein SAMN05216271_1406 [Halopseudomonas sabulinigri]